MKRILAIAVLAQLLQGCASLLAWDERATPASRKAADAEAVEARPARPLAANEHFVKRGDTVYSIAFRNSLDFRELARWNKIGSDYLIFPGEILRLTAPPVPPPAPIHTDDIESQGMPMDHELPRAHAIQPDSPPPEDPPEGDGTPAAADVAGAAGAAVAAAGATAATAAISSSVPNTLANPIKPLPGEIVDPTGFEWTWPTNGVVSRGYAPADGAKGLDFSGNLGQPVFAAGPGRVVYSGNALKGYGELIIIKHDDIHLSAYGYNRKRHVKEGDIVTTGQPIGEMGLGPENKPLLHFEIRERGKATNPVKLLPARGQASAP
ncbi:MAG TPA: peptidoglycan DD-metalloendopeptidase family protein [Solimonas sp.]|nr:peptidoglycan DD-metalloendopeptidase family protein [Solimonas sp.]